MASAFNNYHPAGQEMRSELLAPMRVCIFFQPVLPLRETVMREVSWRADEMAGAAHNSRLDARLCQKSVYSSGVGQLYN